MAERDMKEKGNETKTLSKYKLMKKWEDQVYLGVSVCGDEFVVVKGKKMKWYGMDGTHKQEVICKDVGKIYDVEVLDDEVYVSDILKRSVFVYTKNGRKKREMPLPECESKENNKPLGLAVDRNSKLVYVCSSGTNSVYKWNGEWQKIMESEKGGSMYIAVTGCHHLEVSNHDACTVTTNSLEGELLWTYGSKGSEINQLLNPMGVCDDKMGYVFICDHDNSRVVVLDERKKETHGYVDIGQKIEKPVAVSIENKIMVVTANNHIYVIKELFS